MTKKNDIAYAANPYSGELDKIPLPCVDRDWGIIDGHLRWFKEENAAVKWLLSRLIYRVQDAVEETERRATILEAAQRKYGDNYDS